MLRPYALGRNKRTIRFRANTLFVIKAFSPNLSIYLNKISTSRALLSIDRQ